jgi:hypothetical protein
METLIVAFLALVGSSAVAAKITNGWQRRKYRADTLREGLHQVVVAQAEYKSAVGECAGLLRVYEVQGGRLWNYQRTRFQDAVAILNQQVMAIESAATVNAIVNPWSAELGRRLVSASEVAMKEFGRVTFTTFNNDEKKGVIIELSGGTPQAVAEKLGKALKELDESVGQLTARASVEHENIMATTPRSVGVTTVVLVISAAIVALSYFWFVSAWTYDIGPDRVVGVHRVTGHVRVIPVRDSQPSKQITSAPMNQSEQHPAPQPTPLHN